MEDNNNFIKTQDIIDAIAIKLDSIFNNDFSGLMPMILNDILNSSKKDYKIYDRNVEQGFKYPCFFINLIETKITQFVGNRYNNELSFDILGFAKNNDYRELRNMQDCIDLEYIQLLNGDLLKARKINPKIEDGVLHYMVDYSFVGKKPVNPDVNMGEIEISGEVKHEKG